jgi:hypothetical protein
MEGNDMKKVNALILKPQVEFRDWGLILEHNEKVIADLRFDTCREMTTWLAKWANQRGVEIELVR